MEENIQNQPEDITTDTYVSPDDIDIDLDQDYVINWDAAEQTEEDAIQEQETESVSLGEQAGDSEEMDGGLRVESDQEEYADEGESEEEGYVDDAVELGQIQQYEDDDDDPRYDQESEEEDEYEDELEDEDDYELSEDWQKMIDFMEDYPGATPEDYVRMTSGGEGMSDEQILKMHLAAEHGLDVGEDGEELDFLYEDKFGFDEELDSDRDIKLKKLEAKKALRSAKEQLSETQLKYGSELKFGSSNPEMKELQAFQNEQLELQQQSEELAAGFQESTADYFTNEFKGFEFNYGDGQSQRIKADPSKTAEFQSDISNFIQQYVGEDGSINNLAGYHKALWAANNADALFSHAYEQGKADAVRSSARNAKNIDMDPRSDRSAESESNRSGFKLVDEGDNTENFRFNF